MKAPGPQTVEEAEALPEISPEELLKSGFDPLGIEADCVVLFVGSDGRAMKVEQVGSGYVKVEFNL